MSRQAEVKNDHAALPLQRSVSVQRWRDGETQTALDCVAEEQPVALSYQGVPHVVMMTTPADLEDLGVGFTFTEAIVQRADEIKSVEVFNDAGALEVRLGITAERFAAVLQQRRNLTGRTGCGVCGAETIEQAVRHPSPVGSGVMLPADELHAVLATLHSKQLLNSQTGSVHAAAWCVPGKGIQVLREDVGRHNALDKVIGALLRANLDCRQGYLIITSRASYEMVQKAATAGVALLVAVSAPTALAVELAIQSNMTLVGFARPDQHVVYAHPQRVLS